MRVLIIPTKYAQNIVSRIEAMKTISDESGIDNVPDIRIGDIIELLILDESTPDTDDTLREQILETYGEEIIALKDDIMNKLARLNEIGWFKDVYLDTDLGGVLILF